MMNGQYKSQTICNNLTKDKGRHALKYKRSMVIIGHIKAGQSTKGGKGREE